ncbi:MAG: four helix bundle protein [Ignavibacteria bacterium]
MTDTFPKLEDLNVWKLCREIRIELIKISKRLPAEEKYILKDQMIRAARSITNYIAEGYGRFNYQENIQFLRISRGSLYECLDHLYCCLDENMITKEEFDDLYIRSQSCLKIINGFIKYLRNRKNEL